MLCGSVWASIQYQYDPLNRLSRVDYGDGRSVGFHYDAQGNLLARTVVAIGDDLNHNGIPDAWELMYFGNLTTLTSASDNDHDACLDWQEFWAGTNPTNAASRLRLESPLAPPAAPPGTLVVRWQGVAGKFYRIERATSLTSPTAFTAVASDVPGAAGLTSWTDTSGATAGTLFYRVMVQP